MSNARNDDDLFGEALALPPAERAAFLARACASDAAQRARVEELLAHAAETHGFLETPLAAPPDAPALAEEPGDVIGRYKLLEKIGEGGCGVVFMADQREPVRRRVALKVIKLGMDTREVIARFEVERQALALMDHPNIARVFDGGATRNGRPYFVMELVRGRPITSHCDHHKLTPRQRLELFIAVCQAVQHAHQKGIVHRDLKPSNILVTVNDGVATPKVIDFGIAKATQGPLTDATVFTAFHQFIGTPAYMSPEQADLSSVDIDTRSDIYSLGVLLYELLVGQPPFDAKALRSQGLDEIRRIIREVEPARPSARLDTLAADTRQTVAQSRGSALAQLSFALRGDLDWIVMRCLEKDRARRYETASALAEDLRRHLAHEPVRARPPSAIYTLRKLVRRHRLAVGAAAAIAATVVLGAALSTWQAVRATRAEGEQSRLRGLAQQAQAAETTLRQRAEAQELATRRRAYAADMNLVQQALATENLGRAQELLNRHRPKPGEIDLRGWEWRYLWQFCRSDATAVLKEPDGNSVCSLAASADGKWLAVGGVFGGQLSVLNLQTKERISVPAGAGNVRVAFSPREPLLAIGTDRRERGIGAFSAAAIARGDASANRVLLWDASTRRVVREIALAGACYGLSFSSDGESLAVVDIGPESVISIWQVSDGAAVATAPGGGPSGAAVTPFATTLDLALAATATSGRSSKISVIDLKTGRVRHTLGSGSSVSGLAFSPDGQTLAAGRGASGENFTIHLWEVATGREIGRLDGGRGRVSQLEFLADGMHLVSAGADQTLRGWDIGKRTAVRVFRGHKTEVLRVALMPDQRTLVSGGKDGSVYSWDLLTEREALPFGRIQRGVGGGWGLGAGPGGAFIMNADAAGRVTRRLGRIFQERESLLELGPIQFAVFHPRRPLFAALTGDGRVQVWDWERRVRVREFADQVGRPVEYAGRFAYDGTRLAVMLSYGAGEYSYREWEIATGHRTRAFEFPSAHSVRRSWAPSPDGSRFAAFSYPSGESRLLELQSGRITPLRLDLLEPGMYPGFSPDGRLLAVPSLQSSVRIFDVSANREVAALGGYMFGVHAAAFSPDGKRVVSGSTGFEAIALWDPQSRERVLTLPAEASVLAPVEFSSDGNVLVGQGQSGLHFWRAPSWEEIAKAEAAERAATTGIGK